MVSTFSFPVIDGQVTKVQTITYSNGLKSQRTYLKTTDVVPFDVVWLKPKKIKPKMSFPILFKIATSNLVDRSIQTLRQSVEKDLNTRLGLE